MKKFLLSVPVLMMLLLAGSCGKFGSANFETETFAASDSVTTEAGNTAVVKIHIESPSHNSVAADSINAWIIQSCKSICDNSDLPAPQSDKVDQAYADNFVKGVMSNFSKQLEDPEWAPPGLELSTSFTCDTVTDRFVTYDNQTYIFLGGAHGSFLVFGRTLILENASWLTWNIIPKAKEQEFLTLVLNELAKQYFETTPEEAKAGMFLPENGELPFPVADPVLTDKGLLVTYQQYEIAPYAAGLPQCVIPYDVLAGFVTPETAALFPAPATAG